MNVREHFKRWKRPALWSLLGVAAAALLFVLVFAAGLYMFGWSGSVSRAIVRVLPFPVAMVNGQFASMKDFREDQDTLMRYYASGAATDASGNPTAEPSSQDLDATLLNRVVYESVTQRLVGRYDIAVSDGDVQGQYDTIVAAQGGSADQVATALQTLYGWTPEQFKQKIVVPYLQQQKLAEKLAENGELEGDARQRAENVLALVQKGDTSFEDLAKQYSEDTTASVGGDLGFFAKGEMVQAFEDAAFALQPGEVSGIVKTQYGYHIIKLLARTTDETKGETVQAEHILIKTKTIDDYITEQIAQASVRIFLKGFSWDNDNNWAKPV